MPRLNETLYNLPAISQELVDTLDWAWSIDLGQGNFTQAKAQTEIALLSEWNTSNLLARAIVHQLQGEYDRALSLLEEAFKEESQAKDKLMIATIAYLTERKAQENLVDGCSLSTTKTDTDTLWKEKTKHFKEEVKDLEFRLEINLIQQIAFIFPCWRTILSLQTNCELKEQAQKLIIEELTAQLELYQSKKYYAIAEFFYCYFAEILALSGQFIAGWQLLEKLVPVYSNSAKFLETAWYLMCQGDLIVEINPFGKSIVFGYRIIEKTLDLAKISSLDRSLIDVNTARQKYLQARHYFKLAAATRGEAMVIMRLAYLNGVQKQWHLAACGYEEAQKSFLKLGDLLNARAAEMGCLWSCSQYQTLDTKLLINLEKSANWMYQNKTVTFAMSWLLAFTAAAQEALLQEDGISVSQQLIKVAEIIATKAIDLDFVLSITSCHQLWQKCHLAIGDFYRYLAAKLARQNDWEQAFIATEKLKVYNLHTQIVTIDRSSSLEAKLNSILSIEEIANFLPSDSLILSFVITPTELISLAINNRGLVANHLLDEIDSEIFQASNLEQTFNIWFNNLLDDNPDPKLNEVLEEIFLEPFSVEIEQSKHLLITLCDRLQGLSFAALRYHYRWQSNVLQQEITLGAEKLISYLFYGSQIANCELTVTTTNRVLILDRNGVIINNEGNKETIDLDLDLAGNLSLSQGLALAVAQIYDISPFSKIERITQEIIEAIDFKPVIHLFLAENNTLIQKLIEQNISSELIIINVQNFYSRQLPRNQINDLVQKLINSGTKTVLIIFDNEDSLATAILTSFFHQGLYFGQTIAESLQQAQKQLRLVTATEALDFCHYLESHITWQTKRDRALRALITRYTGDVMVLGKDYARATEAYGAAIKIFTDIGYESEANSLKNNYKMFKSLRKISQPFQAKRLIFALPAYWNNAYIYGDWQLSFVGL